MEKHDLHHDFPQYNEVITELKTSNKHFRKLYDEYNDITKDIHNIEINEKFTDDELNALRTKRVHLKDELFKMISSVSV